MRDTNHEGPRKRHGFVLGALVMLIFALVFTTSAFAAVKLTAALASYDDAAGKWENGNLTMWLNTDPQPFAERLNFDNNSVPDACGPSTSTPWAGVVEFGLGHTDTNGAQGFQSTSNWWAIDCEGYAAGQTTQKYPTADQYLIECVPDNGDGDIDGCELLSVDVVTLCSTGNCTDEIVSTIQGNLDADCDGNIDDPDIATLAANDNLCFYWEAVKPPKPGPGDPQWSGNLQARINSGGGDKTLNFNDMRGPNAITLSRMGVSSAANMQVSIIIGLLALIVVASVAAGLLQRWQSRAR